MAEKQANPAAVWRSGRTVREAAAELSVSMATVNRWVTEGHLLAMKVGGRVRITRASIDGLFQNAAVKKPGAEAAA